MNHEERSRLLREMLAEFVYEGAKEILKSHAKKRKGLVIFALINDNQAEEEEGLEDLTEALPGIRLLELYHGGDADGLWGYRYQLKALSESDKVILIIASSDGDDVRMGSLDYDMPGGAETLTVLIAAGKALSPGDAPNEWHEANLSAVMDIVSEKTAQEAFIAYQLRHERYKMN